MTSKHKPTTAHNICMWSTSLCSTCKPRGWIKPLLNWCWTLVECAPFFSSWKSAWGCGKPKCWRGWKWSLMVFWTCCPFRPYFTRRAFMMSAQSSKSTQFTVSCQTECGEEEKQKHPQTNTCLALKVQWWETDTFVSWYHCTLSNWFVILNIWTTGRQRSTISNYWCYTQYYLAWH